MDDTYGHMSDTIYRQAVLNLVATEHPQLLDSDALYMEIDNLPPAQPQRDIPKKPNETIDRAWGISTRQAVCPNCDAYLGMVHFICESEKKVTYCESCGQAIDWTDWEDNDG